MRITTRLKSVHLYAAVAFAVALALVAMLRYPGGTSLERSTSGYSLTQNPLSDLGMTVAYDGQPNRLGALLFVLSLLILVVLFAVVLIGYVRRYLSIPNSRRWARAAAVFAFLACAGFVGVAATPENVAMSLHIDATLFAFRVSAGTAVLFSIASAYADSGRRRVTAAWCALSVALVAYVALLDLGPDLTTLEGLSVQVIAQKLITMTQIVVLTYLGAEAIRDKSRAHGVHTALPRDEIHTTPRK